MLRERHGIDHVTLQPELSLLMIGVREQPINPGNANG
jgi:hypothetical protein